MSTAFIVSAYKRPDLLARLVSRLDGRPCAVHLDAKVDAAPFAAALRDARGLAWLPRHLCHWGFFGHVEASLEGLRWFLGTGLDHVMLLTGQCYPLRPLDAFEAWTRGLGEASVISHDPFPHPRWRGGGWPRVERTHLRLFGRPLHLPLGRRRLPLGLHPFGGSSYWCLSRSAAKHVMATLDGHPELTGFFRQAWIPDEIVFQTILANSALRPFLVNDDVHYIKWTPHAPSPEVIRDPAEALASGKWFGRKFEDHAVLDEVDRVVAGEATAAAAPARLFLAEGVRA